MDFFSPFMFPSSAEIAEAVPIIISLIIIEGLLSVDNALAIAAMASHLPDRQKYLALKLGIIGAYVFRGICLIFAAYIIANPWLKILGSAYLIYLMCSHFAQREGADEADSESASTKKRGFWGTVLAIEVMDLSLSVDNVVAAVAISPKLWVVCTGVFIGILVLRFLAGYCIKLIEKFPILGDTAFLLIGYVGALLLTELIWHVEIGALGKFIGITIIVLLAIGYERSPLLQKLWAPFGWLVKWPIRAYAAILSVPIGAVFWIFRRIIGLFKGKPIVT